MTQDDISNTIDAARAVCDMTEDVCTTPPSANAIATFRSHLSALDNEKDNLKSMQNFATREKNKWADTEREIRRWKDKVEDHSKRTASALRDMKDSLQSPHP